jgi:hypothetical protein
MSTIVAASPAQCRGAVTRERSLTDRLSVSLTFAMQSVATPESTSLLVSLCSCPKISKFANQHAAQ